ncbi:MAG: putative porin [Verrucomicrobiota bacterium]
MTQKTLTTWALAALCSLGCGAAALAQDSSALLDALVRKKVLTSQEAEDVRADLIKDNAQTNAGKLQLSNSITSLKLYGDIRLRYQYDDVQKQLAAAKNDIHDTQQDRERIRLRLGADFTLNGGFFGGVGLQTAQAADSANQTVNSSSDSAAGFGNYNIYISKAYFGWANDWLTAIGGKQANPFYTTDLVWDPDINPVGAVEKIDIIKGFDALSSNSGDIRSEGPFNLSLVAGQLAFSDNTEANTSVWAGTKNEATHDNATDCWLFDTQLIASAKVASGVKVTVAPGYMTYTNGNTSGVNNSVSFNSTSGTTTYLASANGTAFSSQRDLSIITAPGDVSFKVCGLPAKVLWDFAYNTAGSKRATDVLGLTGVGTTTVKSANGVSYTYPVATHSSRDDIAWLAGAQVGENKKAGDWSVFGNFRQTGIAAVDPNLNDSDFAAGYLNMQGVKAGVNYSLTDYCVASVTYFDAWNLRSNVYGGQATGGNAIAAANSVQLVQVDLNLKF